MIRKEGLTFANKIPWLVELQTLFAHLYPENKERGLAKICKIVLGKSLCKFEQSSNWSNWPLRNSQRHYAALDACVLVQIYSKLVELSAEKGVSLETE